MKWEGAYLGENENETVSRKGLKVGKMLATLKDRHMGGVQRVHRGSQDSSLSGSSVTSGLARGSCLGLPSTGGKESLSPRAHRAHLRTLQRRNHAPISQTERQRLWEVR